MNESGRQHSITRRAFLRRATVATAGVSAALLVGEEMWEAFERLGPRRLLVPGYGQSFAFFFCPVGGRPEKLELSYQIAKGLKARGYNVPDIAHRVSVVRSERERVLGLYERVVVRVHVA